MLGDYVPNLSNIPGSLISAIAEATSKNILCPDIGDVFRVFSETPLQDIKVVILGQDPYHTPGKANGLAFGYHENYSGPLNSSLKSILTEVREDTGQEVQDFTLRSWAKQGVLLLNTRLTTTTAGPLKHKGLGWETVIPAFLERLGDITPPHVYMLWGKEAQSYKRFINTDYNLVLETSHPCKFSAHRGFIGCRHFSQANKFLRGSGREEICWGER